MDIERILEGRCFLAHAKEALHNNEFGNYSELAAVNIGQVGAAVDLLEELALSAKEKVRD